MVPAPTTVERIMNDLINFVPAFVAPNEFVSLKGIFKEIVDTASRSFPAHMGMNAKKLAELFTENNLGSWSQSNFSNGTVPRDSTPEHVRTLVKFCASRHSYYGALQDDLAARAFEIASVNVESGGRRQEAKSAICDHIKAILGSTETLGVELRDEFTGRLLDLCVEFGGEFDPLSIVLPAEWSKPDVDSVVPETWEPPTPKPRKKKVVEAAEDDDDDDDDSE